MSDEKSPLQQEIDVMARTVSIIAVICGIALFFAALLIFKFGAVPALLFALGVMVALVPEGLPATLSVALAIGVQRMAKENALIKKLMGVETLGSTNVICTDKTGTLTKAEMTVKEMFAGDTVVEVDRRRLRAGRRVRRRRHDAAQRRGPHAASSCCCAP